MLETALADRSERKGALAVLAALIAMAALGTGRPGSSAAPGPRSIPPLAVDLNRASEAELGLLPGLGPDRARRLVVHRAVYGPFRSVDEIERVKGIGAGAAERLRGLASAGGKGSP